MILKTRIRGRIGSYGGLVFECSSERVETFSSWRRSSGGRYAEHTIYNKKSVLEYVGVEVQELEMEVTLHGEYGIPIKEETEMLRRMAESGEASVLVIGGEVIGEDQWILERVREVASAFDGRGNPLVMKVSLSLKEYRSEG